MAGYLEPTVLLAQLHEPEASNHHRKMKPRRQNPQLAESRSRNMRLAHSVGLDAMRTASPHRGARESFSLDIPSHRISEIAGAAQKLEDARQYDRALAKWETLSTVYPQYPDLNIIIKRVRGLRDRAHTDARQHWIDRIENALSICDYAQASLLAGQANQEFPVDSDLMELAEKAEVALRQRAKAQKMLAEGRQSFANQQWEAGAQIMLRAYQLASEDALIRDQAVSELAQASRTTVEKNWRASEVILRCLAEIQPSAAGSPELQATIQERRREEAITNAVDAARKKQASGDLQGALGELEQALVWYPEDRRLRDLQSRLESQIQQTREAARLEEIRREKEGSVLDVLSRAQQAFVLDVRVQILEEALGKYPQETRLQQQLNSARELRNRVASLANDARNLEQSRQYDLALAKWEALATAYRDYPDLVHILEQARQRHQQARLEAKANCVRMLQLALASAEYKRAEEILAQAKRDFPGDRELAEIEKRVRDGIANRAQAEKLLAGAAKAVEKEKWKKALESFQEANAAAKSDPVIRDQVVRGLLSAADAALQSDCDSSEMLVAEAARVQPDSTLLGPVRSRIEAWKRSQLTEQCLSAAQRCLSVSDRQGALRSLDRGLAAYPNEPRLLESKERVEGEIRRREEETRAKELREKEAREKELRDKAQREEEHRRVREQELRLQEARNEEARERELREEQQRAQARALEQSRRTPMPPGSEDVSATRIFSRGADEAAPGVSALTASPVTPPNAQPNSKQDSPPAAPIHSPDGRLTQRLPALADVLGATSGQTRDTTIFEKADMRTASFEGGLTHIQPGLGSDELNEALLHTVERQLAAFIGPLAKVLVKRAASKTNSSIELYTILAASLEREDDRKAFLAKRTELAHGKATAPSSTSAPAQAGMPLTTTFEISSSGEITPAAIEQAARRLAAHLGPIANVLARKEAKRAATLRNFYELLAVHVANPTERERFLKEAGI